VLKAKTTPLGRETAKRKQDRKRELLFGSEVTTKQSSFVLFSSARFPHLDQVPNSYGDQAQSNAIHYDFQG
jgi:hypothetical protein